ncbi:MAG: PolC-type DNA polymerase III [Lachnospiraceae bacterium]|nr:PolC-type DNA polymerase III [Lachnospiraceae bacterium]
MQFLEVFDGLRSEERLKKIFESSSVTDITSSSKNNRMDVYIDSDKFIKTDDRKAMEKLLLDQFFVTEHKDVFLHIRCIKENGDIKDIWSKYNVYIDDEFQFESGLLESIYKNADIRVNGDKISIELDDNFINRQTEKKIKDTITVFFSDYFGLTAQLEFSYKAHEDETDDEHQSYIEHMESYITALENEEFDTVAEAADTDEKKAEADNAGKKGEQDKSGKSGSAGKADGADKGDKSKGFNQFDKSKFVKKKIAPKDPDVIYGTTVEGDVIDICDIIDNMGDVVIKGMILKMYDTIKTKTGKYIFKFSITDFTDSIICKFFLKDDDDFNIVNDNIKEGKFFIIKGIAETDDFEMNHETTIQRIRGVKPIKDFRVKRRDDAPVKRIELHAHTQMSDMDGVIPADVLVKRAFDWGHRGIAITDHGVVQSFTIANHALNPKKMSPEDAERFKSFKIIYGCEGYIVDDEPDTVTDAKGNVFKKQADGKYSDEDLKKMPSYHIILLCKNDTGRINLYKLVSLSHINYFSRRPRIPKSLLKENREGIIVGSACEAGELFRAVVHDKPMEEIRRVADFYDYYEIQQIGNNAYMIEDEDFPEIQNENDLRRVNKRICDLADADGKMCIATCDVHFLDPEDEVYRRIIMAAKGFKDADKQAPLYLHTTDEMLEECSYLGKDKAYEVVVTNPNRVFDMCEKITPVRPDKSPPVIPDSDKTLRDICETRAHQIYGPELPKQVSARLEHELESIIKNGFAVMYIIAQKLVWKSNEDGYLVGSRGSVGSSFVATMSGITEINPLPPHYYCPECHYSDFDSDTCKEYVSKSGFDMPDKDCPVCGHKLVKEGQNIPFETFLGFNGDKEPDIDLNFSGEYQSKAHDYTEVIFGAGQTFRAGTIGALADKTAYGEVSKYFEEHGMKVREAEKDRIVAGCVGVKRTTGQHPGGIVVLPLGENIYSFTPVQHPANDMTVSTVTTHFDYHSIDHNLLKLDILGHDDPTMIRMLEDLTGLDAKTIRMDDPKVISLFASCDVLGVTPEQIDGVELGSLGLPELGTNFVIQMLKDTKPQSFSDMVKISGLSHGTDVWLNNAQYFIKNGDCTLSTAICTRDDIMIYLINMGLDPGHSFKIMESVRKGKGLTPEMEEEMIANNVPAWYIESCKRIKYMFPKAHACAYMIMAFRIAYFKVYYPLAYYCAFFSIRASDFDYAIMCKGKDHLRAEMKKLNEKQKTSKLSAKESGMYDDMRLVLEFYERGFEFMPIDIYKAKARHFQMIDGKLMPSLSTINGLGDKAAEQIEDASSRYKYVSRQDFKSKCKIGESTVETMAELGILDMLPKSDQMSFEDFFGKM